MPKAESWEKTFPIDRLFTKSPNNKLNDMLDFRLIPPSPEACPEAGKGAEIGGI